MIEEQAKVVAVDADCAEILIHKQPACGSCSASRGCGTSLLASWLPRRRLTFRVKNRVNARPGDTVVLGLDETALQKGSLMLYALPLVGLITGAITGEHGFDLLGLSQELGAAVLGLLGLIAALVFVHRKGSAIVQQGDGGVRLLRVVHSPASFAPVDLSPTDGNQTESFGTHK